MNKQEKELQQQYLNNEKAVLKLLEQNYADALAEINSKIELLMARQDADMSHVIYQVEYQKALKTQVQAILETLQANEFETVSEYLTQSYEDGYIGAMYSLQSQGIPLIVPIDQKQVVEAIQHETNLSEKLYTAMGHDIKDLQKKISGEISRGLSSGQMYSEISRNIASWARIPKNNAVRIARTEAHRIQTKASMDACQKAKSKGADVVKQWDASLDSRTRKSHARVDGEIRELDEKFSNGLMYPGDPSGDAEDVINCRCTLLQRARWALDEDELNTLKERAEYFGLDKTENFEDYKKKYLQASERVREDAQKMNDGLFDAQNIKELNKKASEMFVKFGIDDVDFSGVDLNIAKKNVSQIYNLLGQYKTELKSIETTTSKKYLGNVMRSGSTKSQLETATMQISKKYAGKRETWIEEIIKGIEKGDTPKIKPENYDIYPLTHEFAHTFGNDYINMFYGFNKNDDFWKEIDDIRREYQKAYQRDKTISLGKYATTNNDEFIAECFAEALLSDNPSQYSIRTKELIDKYFKKTPLENSGKSSTIDTKKEMSKYIGKPITQHDNQSVREWYYANVHDIKNQIDTTKPFAEQVQQAYNLRNQYKHDARLAMSDKETVERLEKKRPIKTFDELLEDKMKRKNLTREEALKDILKTASKTNADVDSEFGLRGE